MDNQRKALILANNSLLIVLLEKLRQRQEEKGIKSRRRFLVNPHLVGRSERDRFAKDFENLIQNPSMFYENFHMSSKVFHELFSLLEEHLLPKRSTRRDAISPIQKLAVVIEYFASGDFQRHLTSMYRISKSHFGDILEAVSDAICLVLSSEVPPWEAASLLKYADEFDEKWNFPNCVGALDGKCVPIKAPGQSGSLSSNKKGSHSITILAVCDASCRFTYLDVGIYAAGDVNVFSSSNLGSSILQDRLTFPADKKVEGIKLPYFIVGNDSSPLCKRIMKPFTSRSLNRAERNFNQRLSRPGQCIEKAFGILCWKWMCLQRTLQCKPEKAQKIVRACCLLHNFVMRSAEEDYWGGQTDCFDDAELPLASLPPFRGRPHDYAKFVRDSLRDFVNSENGSVPEQTDTNI